MIIQAKNNQTEVSPVTYLSTALSAAGTVAYVRNNASFSNSYMAQFGETGEEKTEIKAIGTAGVGTAGTSLTLGTAVKFDHPVDCPVYCLKYDKIIFKVSDLGTAGTVSPITNGTVAITPDSNYTQFEHTDGSVTYAYKTAFYNSVTLLSSDDSDWITFDGYKPYMLAGIRDRVRAKIVDSSFVTDSDIDCYINEWLERMNSSLIKINRDYALSYFDVTFSGTTQEVDIPVDDFVQARRVWMSPGATFDETQAHKAFYSEMTRYFPQETYNEALPKFYFMGNSKIGRHPNSQTVTARVWYYALTSNLTDDTDSLPLPMRNYTTSFVNYALSCAHYRNNDQAEAKEWENKAMIDLKLFEDFITPRDKSNPEYVDIVEDFGSDSPDDVWY